MSSRCLTLCHEAKAYLGSVRRQWTIISISARLMVCSPHTSVRATQCKQGGMSPLRQHEVDPLPLRAGKDDGSCSGGIRKRRLPSVSKTQRADQACWGPRLYKVHKLGVQPTQALLETVSIEDGFFYLSSSSVVFCSKVCRTIAGGAENTYAAGTTGRIPDSPCCQRALMKEPHAPLFRNCGITSAINHWKTMALHSCWTLRAMAGKGV